MLWRLTLAVAVVCVGSICSCEKADVMSRLMVPRDYGVKLCGREFIRAVIFTCGGSRWRRSTEGLLDPFQWSSLPDVKVEESQHTWQRGAELAENHSPLHTASLADILALYGSGDRQQQQPLSLPAPLEELQLSTIAGEQDETPGSADWHLTSKKKRNFSRGVAGMCCNQGCTKNDIGRLC
ncbi:prorelaxin H1 [Archocentrus centrarchus]|uniref:Insulin-like domain-containing protein n=1 Tax=Amphilophus citrinellus TaxID=61819 RepID=A0A3Q0R395_AMPCI|nr:relaxin-3-like [Archocentrus centrarchus]